MTTIQGKSRSAGRTARGLCIEENWISHLICASAEIQTEANLEKKKKKKNRKGVLCHNVPKEKIHSMWELLLITAKLSWGREHFNYSNNVSSKL